MLTLVLGLAFSAQAADCSAERRPADGIACVDDKAEANAADIATNASDIAANASDIAANTSDIAANASDIATNASDIAANAADITALDAEVGDLSSDAVTGLHIVTSFSAEAVASNWFFIASVCCPAGETILSGHIGGERHTPGYAVGYYPLVHEYLSLSDQRCMTYRMWNRNSGPMTHKRTRAVCVR